MRFLVGLLMVFFIVMAVLSLFRNMFASNTPRPHVKSGSRGVRNPPSAGKLVKDPVCGTYVAPGSSPSTTLNGQTSYFCSEDCRTAFTTPRSGS